MARPVVRTAKITAEEKAEVRKLFGTVMNAYRQLMPGGTPLSWAVFRVVASGGLVKPADATAFQSTLSAWKRRTLK